MNEPAPLPFPELPDLILKIMARQPEAPHGRRDLTERAGLEIGTRELPTFDDVDQCLWRLSDAGQVIRGINGVSRAPFWKLTTAGKLNQGLS